MKTKPDKHRDEMVQALLRYKRSHDQFAMKKLIQKAAGVGSISEIPPDKHIYTRVIAACKAAPLTEKDLARELQAYANKNGVAKMVVLIEQTTGCNIPFREEKIHESYWSKIIDACGRIKYYPADDYRANREFERDNLHDVMSALDRYEERYGKEKTLAMFQRATGIKFNFEYQTAVNIPRAMWGKIINACRGVKPKPQAKAQAHRVRIR